MEYLSILLSILAVLLAIYFYVSIFSGLNYFKDNGILHVPPVPIVGNMGSFLLRQISLAELVQKIYNIHPEAKYVGFYDFTNPVVLIRDPELIKTIAVKNFETFPYHRSFVDEAQDPLFGKNLFSLRGEKWKDVRTLLSPAFTSSKMKNMFTLMSSCAEDFTDFMSKLSEEKNVMELKDAFTRYTNDVIATCAFGISMNSMRDPMNEFYLLGKEGANFNTLAITAKFFLIRNFPGITKFFGMRLIKKRVEHYFSNIVKTTIQTRDEKGIYRPDMIQLMMESRQKRESGKELTIQDMTSQAFVFFLGGFDTSSTLMCFAAHQLAVHPDVHEKLQNEIDRTFEDCNGQLTYEAVSKMQYLDAVIDETQRVYPPAVFLDRMCDSSFELPPALPGAKPVTLKKGTNVWFPAYGIHRDPKYYDNPDVFDPERFINDGKKIHNSGAYIPFGLGPRMCIGNRFALLETKVLLCHLLARCDIKPCAKTRVPMKLQRFGLGLMPEGGFWVKIQARKNPCPYVQTPMTNGTCKA